MSLKIVLFSLISCIALSTANITNYEGCKVYEINAKNELEKKLVFELSSNNAYDFFNLPKIIGKPAQVMVRPQDQLDFETTLAKYGIEYNVTHHNIQEVKELERAQKRYSPPNKQYSFDFTTIFHHIVIYDYLHKLAKLYKKRVYVRTIGKSFENREIKAIYITDGYKKKNKNVILVDAGIHGSENITPPTALYIVYQLVEKFNKNRELLKNYIWIVVPIVNPDGMAFIRRDPFWRKTRRPINATCDGTNIEYNFDFHWGIAGSSNCYRSKYRGPYPFSESETRAVRNLLLSVKGRAKFYLSLHHYLPTLHLLYPWFFTKELPNNWKDMDKIAKAGAYAIKEHSGKNYTVNSSSNVLNEDACTRIDYAYGKVGIPIVITMIIDYDASVKDTSQPFADNAWIGIKAMAKNVIEKYL